MKKTSRIKAIANSKFFWAIVSLLASLSIWVYVTSVEVDEVSRPFRNVQVEIVGEEALLASRNLRVTDVDTSAVTVEIKGPRRVVNALDSSDLMAVVDVSRLTQASYTSMKYDIDYPSSTNQRDLQVVQKTPENINFTVSLVTSKTVQVRGGFEGKPADGFTAETPVFEPSTIVVTGPEAYLKNVDHAWVTFGRDVVAESSYSVDTGFILRDANNEAVSSEYLNFSQDTIRATLPILEIKEVTLDVDVIEGAGATSANTKISIEPSSVMLAGDSAILGGINRIVLGTIDLTDFTSTYSETFRIPLDNQIRNITGLSEAKVTVEIVGLETRSFSISKDNLSCINAAEDAEVEILTESIDVILRGPAEALDEIQSDNITAVADLSDYKDATGSYMPVVRVYVYGLTDVGAIGENTISIVIRKA